MVSKVEMRNDYLLLVINNQSKAININRNEQLAIWR